MNGILKLFSKYSKFSIVLLGIIHTNPCYHVYQIKCIIPSTFRVPLGLSNEPSLPKNPMTRPDYI